jgi:hypothetical protein
MSSDEEFTTMDSFLEAKEESNDTFMSNFNDVIKEDYKNTNIKSEHFFYQPQITDEKCRFNIVGYYESGKPMVKICEIPFNNDKILCIAHLYDSDNIKNVTETKYIEIISLILNKENYDMKISLRLDITEELIEQGKPVYAGKYCTYFKYKKLDKNIEKKLQTLKKYPGSGKTIELLVKELLNPLIIDNYE